MSRSHSIAFQSIRSAFTIIELLVAVAVTALLVTFMVTVTTNVLSAWNRSSGVLTSGNQARVILDQLSQDLQGAVIRRGPDVMFAASLQESPPAIADRPPGAEWIANSKPNSVIVGAGVSASPLLSDTRFGQAGVWLRFFTTPSDNTEVSGSIPLQNTSAPRAVAYQLSRVKVGSATSEQISYRLYRSEVRPSHDLPVFAARSVFALGYDLFGANAYNQPTNTNSGHNFTGTTDNGGEPGSIRKPDNNQMIGNDVIDFGVRLFERNATGDLIEIFPVDRRVGSNVVPVFAATTDTAKRDPFNSTVTHSFGYPAVAEVFVRILSQEGVRQLTAFELGLLEGVWWDIAIQHSQVYTRRIEIKSKGL